MAETWKASIITAQHNIYGSFYMTTPYHAYSNVPLDTLRQLIFQFQMNRDILVFHMTGGIYKAD